MEKRLRESRDYLMQLIRDPALLIQVLRISLWALRHQGRNFALADKSLRGKDYDMTILVRVSTLAYSSHSLVL